MDLLMAGCVMCMLSAAAISVPFYQRVIKDLYPALSAKEDSGVENYQTEEVPEDVSLFGGWIHVGRNFVTDLWDVDNDLCCLPV